MSTLKFTETHNLVAFLKKPTESDRFEHIVNFLNANPIKYTLTVNPTIYTSCIQQFWDSAKVKTIYENVHIRALIDGKKIIVTEASIRRDLQLQDVKGTACLPNDTIFEELARMGIITPLFETMMVQAPEEVGEGSELPTDTYHIPTVTQPSTSSQPYKKQKSRMKQRKETEGTKDAKKEVSTANPVTTAGEVVTTAKDVKVTTVAATIQISKDVVTLAHTLIKIKATKPRARGVIVQEPNKFRTTSSSQPSQLPQAKEKGKGIMVELEKPLKKKEQIMMDEEVARKLEAQMKAKMEEEERIAREKDEANIAMIEE
uniref:Xylulose kinase-1 n=1 Tax=Tanacetum cinerariifolium TaxID=118510 RepID=A0A6L2NW79_TANCI|nr:hypothetical protein [Tanacetum cinerariifolium]